MRKKGLSPAQRAFIESDYFKEARRKAAEANLKRFAEIPKCGAKKRSDGQPCRNPGRGAGGRCKFHGGGTPKGKAWHKAIVPDENSTTPKDQRKRRILADRAADQAERRESMSPEERAKHERWHAQHDPDTVGERAARWKIAKKGIDVTEMKKRGTREELLEEIRTAGAWKAYEASLAILEDPNANRREKAQVASNIFRAGGFYGATEEEALSNKQPSEMSADQLQTAIEAATRRLAQLAEPPSERKEDQDPFV